MHHSTHGNSDGHHWYADFIILCFLMTHFKDLSQAHTIVYLKKYNSKIPTFTPSLLNQNIESLSTICRLQENKMLQKTATTGRQPVEFNKRNAGQGAVFHVWLFPYNDSILLAVRKWFLRLKAIFRKQSNV